MTTTIAVLALVVAAAAAVRSTWSPCGLSMMSTITPLAERGRGHRYGVTCAWFASGALLGGLALGGFIAALATAVGASSLTPVVVGTTALVTTLIVLVSDVGLAGVRLPVHHRQVNERWLDAVPPLGLRGRLRLPDRYGTGHLRHHRRRLPAGRPRGADR